MIIMPIPRDIRNFRPKVIGPLDRRMTISVAVCAAYTYVVCRFLAPYLKFEDMVAMIAVPCIPIILCGFVDVCGLPLWVYAKQVLYNMMFVPQKRPYRTNNIYEPYAQQHMFTYDFFEEDDAEGAPKSIREKKKIEKQRKQRLKAFIAEHPECERIR